MITRRTICLLYTSGPDKDGGYGPYVQSERLDIYKEYGNRLLEMGGAYHCFCKKDPQHSDEDSPMRRDPCRFLNQKEVQEKLDLSLIHIFVVALIALLALVSVGMGLIAARTEIGAQIIASQGETTPMGLLSSALKHRVRLSLIHI